MLKKLTNFNGLEADMAADYMANPPVTTVERPFHIIGETSQEGGSHTKTAKPKQKPTGTVPTHSERLRKYGRRTMPKLLRALIKKSAASFLLRGVNKKQFVKYCSASLARSTWLKYGSVFNTYIAFCRKKAGKVIWPPTERALNSFVLWCAYRKNLSEPTIRSYISALATVQNFVCPEKAGLGRKTVELLLQGVRNKNSGQSCRRKSDPLTFNVLREIRTRLREKHWSRLSKNVLWTICIVGYFGAFRAGELLTKNERVFDRFSDLLWADIDLGKTDRVTLTVKIPKASRGVPDFVHLFHIPKRSYCPVCCLKKLRHLQKVHGVFSESEPVFRFGTGKSVTVSSFSSILARLLRHSQLANLRITAKSMRSGLPTDLEQDPDIFPDAHIKNWGRWKSRAYQGYMKDDSAQRQWVFAKISESLANKFKMW